MGVSVGLCANERALLADCPFSYTLALLGRRWKPAVLWKVLEGEARRFGDLRRALPGVSDAALARTLRDLAADGLLERRELRATFPQHVEYPPTPRGLSLRPILGQLYTWGELARAAARHDAQLVR